MISTKRITAGVATGLLAISLAGGVGTAAYADVSSHPATQNSSTQTKDDNSYQFSVASSDKDSIVFDYQLGKNIKIEAKDGALGLSYGSDFEKLPETIKAEDGSTVHGHWTQENGKLVFNIDKTSHAGTTTTFAADNFHECVLKSGLNGMITGGLGGALGGPGAASVGAVVGSVGGFIGGHITCS